MPSEEREGREGPGQHPSHRRWSAGTITSDPLVRGLDRHRDSDGRVGAWRLYAGQPGALRSGLHTRPRPTWPPGLGLPAFGLVRYRSGTVGRRRGLR